ncbi:sensor histidine kinase N-terminal domain-containing protein [Variovorax sp. PCZ-1]|nr:sensor histidine kinase N-terminal domain-containing protein [Variovorax sp. PCZ-1]
MSLRRRLLWGILLPVILFVLIDSIVIYRQSLTAANTAYDRTLLASAKTIAEQLDVQIQGGQAMLVPRVPYAALEAFEADNRSRMFYRVTGFSGEMVSGFESLKLWTGRIADQPPYAALVDFYDDAVDGTRVRVAVLLQPVSGAGGNGMATVQVAETLELREALAREILVSTLWRQAILLAVIAAVVIWVVQSAVRPVRRVSREIAGRAENDLSPVDATHAPRELQPLLQANNQLMVRLDHLLQHQKRFVRDAAHQLRTPLAVLKTQTQSALRGDVPPQQALSEIGQTVDRATELANQMLSLAKVEQLRQQAASAPIDWSIVLREVALDLAPLIADKDLEFELETQPALVIAHDWMLREMVRNLLHNAIKHSPVGGSLNVSLRAKNQDAELLISDSGAGVDDELKKRLFQPFSAGRMQAGSGLGLAICAEITRALHGEISLDNRMAQDHIAGLDVCVKLPLRQRFTQLQPSS